MAEKQPFVLIRFLRNVFVAIKMPDQVAAQIRRMIVRGEIGEGDWLPTEAELIERFGILALLCGRRFGCWKAIR